MPFLDKLNLNLPAFSGSLADLLILIIHKIFAFGSPKLEIIKSDLFIILVNM